MPKPVFIEEGDSPRAARCALAMLALGLLWAGLKWTVTSYHHIIVTERA